MLMVYIIILYNHLMKTMGWFLLSCFYRRKIRGMKNFVICSVSLKDNSWSELGLKTRSIRMHIG